MKTKSIKDAIHGYISIEEPYWRIIDKAEFQRLKWIEQTSYRVLYPSARHDRFIHSIGVFHLGKRAIKGFRKNCESFTHHIDKYEKSFLLACLLHDIGHAPFSHTCENLYFYGSKTSAEDAILNKQLLENAKKVLDNDAFNNFESDYKKILKSNKGSLCKPPSEHEIMSALIVLKMQESIQNNFSDNIDFDLVIRAILGCTYSVSSNCDVEKKEICGIKNCFVRFLNSSVVDVDKLDYIARDSRMSGFDNIVIDIERLLNGLTYVIDSGGIIYPAYNKSSLNVLGNVFLAKNAQSQWIVEHPIVLYDSYLLTRAIGLSINKLYEKSKQYEKIQNLDQLIKKIFSCKTLSKEGEDILGEHISLLSDIDILFWMKQQIDNELIAEYFDREKRKHAIWKSHGEFLYYLSIIDDKMTSEEEKAKIVSDYLAPLNTYINGISSLGNDKVINRRLLDERKEEIEGQEELKKILEDILSYDDGKKDSKFEYCILGSKNNFSVKINANNIFIRFGDANQYCKYSNLIPQKDIEKPKDYMFFFLYCNEHLHTESFVKYIFEKAKNASKIQV